MSGFFSVRASASGISSIPVSRRPTWPGSGHGGDWHAGLTPHDIDFIVVGTTTPDMMFPSTACLVQHKIGADQAWGFDLGAACSGFTYAADDGGAHGGGGNASARARDWRRRHVEHHRLHGSLDVRPVRRWRGRGRGESRRPTAAASSISRTKSMGAEVRRSACRRAAACGRRHTRPSTSVCTT